MEAISKGYKDIAKLLIDKSADLSVVGQKMDFPRCILQQIKVISA
jgi:hypothetical protein